jgi:hypothetical protein
MKDQQQDTRVDAIDHEPDCEIEHRDFSGADEGELELLERQFGDNRVIFHWKRRDVLFQ